MQLRLCTCKVTVTDFNLAHMCMHLFPPSGRNTQRITVITVSVVLSVAGSLLLIVGFAIWQRRSSKTMDESNKLAPMPLASNQHHAEAELMITPIESLSPNEPQTWPRMQCNESGHFEDPVTEFVIEQSQESEGSFMTGLVPYRHRNQSLVAIDVQTLSRCGPHT